MAKALKIAAVGIGAVALIATGVGAVALGGLAGSLTVFGVSTGTLLLAAGGLSVAATLLQKGPTVPSAQTDRLTASIDPRAFRKTVLGQTAMATDVRYEEWNGGDQDYCEWIVAHASHAIEAVDEIWLNDEMAWSLTTGVTAKFVGYFWVHRIILEGTPANAFVLGQGKWNTAHRLTGCAYSHLMFKVTGNGKKGESPFSGGPPSRITVIGRGAKLYDPRRDSTVPGGSGPMRWNDQSTWRYTADDGVVIGENLPLQILRVVLGWRIRNPVTGEMRLATGSGVPGRRLLLPSFQIAANIADEAVNKAAGGTEPRYHGAAVISEGDDPKTSLDMLCAACCARFRDTGGKLAISIAHNDLAAAAADDGLNDDDVVGGFSWDPDPSLEATPNVVRGKYVDASTNSLYQMIDYPEVRLPSPDGQDRIYALDLGAVESPSHAQRVGRQVLQRKQYARTFTAPFDIRAWKYTVGDVVPFTFAPLSFVRMLFRVAEQELGQGGTCNMTLAYESAVFYAWDASDQLAVQAAEALTYDASKNPLVLAIADAGRTADWDKIADPTGTKPADNATVGAPIGTTVGDRLAEQVVSDLDLNALNQLAEATLAGTWRAASDQVIYTADGRPIRTVVEQLGTTVDGHTLFVSSLQAVDASAGTSKFLFAARADGTIVGIEGVAGAGFDMLAFMASRFTFVDNSGANPIQALSYEGGVWKLKSIEVDRLKANIVETKHIVGSAVQQTNFVILSGDIGIARGTTATVLTVNFTKDEDGSALKLQFFGMFWSPDDLQFSGAFVVDGATSYSAGQVNIILDNNASQGRMPITPFLYLEGISAGPHTITFSIYNGETDNVPLTVKAGSALEVLELKGPAR